MGKASMKYTKEQYEEVMRGYFSPDEEVSNEQTRLVRVRKEHNCMGLNPEGDCSIKTGDFAIVEKAIHVDMGRVSCYVCLLCADKWLDECLSRCRKHIAVMCR